MGEESVSDLGYPIYMGNTGGYISHSWGIGWLHATPAYILTYRIRGGRVVFLYMRINILYQP